MYFWFLECMFKSCLLLVLSIVFPNSMFHISCFQCFHATVSLWPLCASIFQAWCLFFYQVSSFSSFNLTWILLWSFLRPLFFPPSGILLSTVLLSVEHFLLFFSCLFICVYIHMHTRIYLNILLLFFVALSDKNRCRTKAGGVAELYVPHYPKLIILWCHVSVTLLLLSSL